MRKRDRLTVELLEIMTEDEAKNFEGLFESDAYETEPRFTPEQYAGQVEKLRAHAVNAMRILQLISGANRFLDFFPKEHRSEVAKIAQVAQGITNKISNEISIPLIKVGRKMGISKEPMLPKGFSRRDFEPWHMR